MCGSWRSTAAKKALHKPLLATNPWCGARFVRGRHRNQRSPSAAGLPTPTTGGKRGGRVRKDQGRCWCSVWVRMWGRVGELGGWALGNKKCRKHKKTEREGNGGSWHRRSAPCGGFPKYRPHDSSTREERGGGLRRERPVHPCLPGQ